MTDKTVSSCPFCEAEENGVSSGWGMSQPGWDAMKKAHDAGHPQGTVQTSGAVITTPTNPPTETVSDYKNKEESMSKKLEVISDEDGEQYLCTGTNSRKVACKAIRKFMRDDCGIDEDYIEDVTEDSLELVPVWDGSKDQPDYTYWGIDRPDITSKYVGSGWRWSL